MCGRFDRKPIVFEAPLVPWSLTSFALGLTSNFNHHTHVTPSPHDNTTPPGRLQGNAAALGEVERVLHNRRRGQAEGCLFQPPAASEEPFCRVGPKRHVCKQFLREDVCADGIGHGQLGQVTTEERMKRKTMRFSLCYSIDVSLGGRKGGGGGESARAGNLIRVARSAARSPYVLSACLCVLCVHEP